MTSPLHPQTEGGRTIQRIVILGGGFGGIYAALGLERIFARRQDVEIILISGENFLLFTPMLAEVVSSSIEASHIVSPIRAFFKKVKVQNSDVHLIDIEKRVVISSHCPRCGSRELTFDHLVLSLGSTTDFRGLPGVAENALPMKTLGDAMALRNHIIDVLEHAEIQTDHDLRKAMLTFVVAGAGFAGTETAAEVNDFAQTARRSYPSIRQDEIRVVLVHSGDRIMPEIGGRLADYALRKIKQRGIRVILNVRVASATNTLIQLSDKTRIATNTLIWTAGVAPCPLLSTLPCLRNRRNQVVVNEHLEVPGHPGIWALGDCAAIVNSHDGKACPPTAQHAIRQGKLIANNIGAALGLGVKESFAYKPLGIMASLGRRCAVAEIGGLNFSGFFAWWLWRTVYLLKLPGLERKLRVALDWTLDLFFTRDTVLLKLLMRSGVAAPEPLQTAPHVETETAEHIA